MGELFFDEEAQDDPVWEEVPEPSRRTGARLGWLLVLGVPAVLLVAAVLAGISWVNGKVDPPGDAGAEVALTIPNGSAPQEIGELLAEEGVITDPEVWRWYLRATGDGPFLAGEYTFQENSSMGEAIDVLEAGPALADFTNVTIPEGLTVEEIIGVVSESGVLDGARFAELARSGAYRSRYQPEGVTSLEGLLFPDTYRIEEGEDEESLLTRMIASLDAVATEAGYDEAEARTGRSAYELLTIASLIEAEAKVDEDRAKISRVIHNRLEEGMTLGIDATVYYALGRKGGSLTESDLAVDSPYNTRQVAGLPPTPIAASGRASIEAAINPEEGPWLYYVLADESGVHAFSEGYDEFLDNVAEAREKGLL